MCGICGLIRTRPARPGEPDLLHVLQRMQSRLRHRGPDDQGQLGPLRFSDPRGAPPSSIALGHCRLSIIDLHTGQQPIANEDESIHLVANAEIYNFRELTTELESHNHRFRTRADVECILHLYEEHGEACFQHIHGMFAIALWDSRQHRLLLARDRLGKKPLWYHHGTERFAFASELAALLEVPGIERTIDYSALDHYLTLQYIPAPLSIFTSVRKLPPAHYLVWKHGDVRTVPYWRLAPEPLLGPWPETVLEESCRQVRQLLEQAVARRMVADVEVGAFLSGGLDSSLVVALMSRHSDKPVKTFSIGFEQQAYNELPFARLMAEHCRTEHHEFTVRPDALAILPSLLRHYGEPYADSSAIPTYYLARMTREHVKVALNGDGGDESFAGYPRYKAMKLAAILDRLPRGARSAAAAIARTLPAPFESKSYWRRLRKFLTYLPHRPEARYVRYVSIFAPELRQALYTLHTLEQVNAAGPPAEEFLLHAFAQFAGGDIVRRAALVDIFTYLPGDLLVKIDIATMANSLETRSPFFDSDLVSYAATLPSEFKLRGWTSKHLLKCAFVDLVPPQILHRKKMGFGVPMANWLRGDLQPFLRDTLLSETAARRAFFRHEVVRSLVERHCTGRENYADQLWALLCFELWCRAFLDGEA